MRILFDQGTPPPCAGTCALIRRAPLPSAARSTSSNGELLKHAEEEGYEVFFTTDQSLRYQQNLAGRRIGIVVLMATSRPRTKQHIPAILAAVSNVIGGGYEEVPL